MFKPIYFSVWVIICSAMFWTSAGVSQDALIEISDEEVIPPTEEAQDAESADTEEEEEEEEEVEEEEKAAAANNPWGIDPKKLIAAKKFQLTQTLNSDIELVDQLCQLDKKQKLKLSIGAKGAAKKLLGPWKKSIGQNFGGQLGLDDSGDDEEVSENDENQNNNDSDKQPVKKKKFNRPVEIKDADELDAQLVQFVGDNVFGITADSKRPIDSVVWQKMLSSVLNDEQQKKIAEYREQRNAAKRAAMILYTVESLSLELSLSDDQRDKLEELITPQMQNAKLNCSGYYEAMVMYYCASKVKVKDLKKLLSPSQIQTWKLVMAQPKQFGQMFEAQNQVQAVEAGWGLSWFDLLGEFGQQLEFVFDRIERMISGR